MTQNRKPPAYQEYAATVLSDRNFRLMTLAERGLFYSMRLECWQNGTVPVNANELAKYLGYPLNDVTSALTENVKAFFKQNETDYICPELEDYRQHLNEQKKRQSDGGKKGAQKVNAKHIQQSSTSMGNLQVPRQVGRESLVKSSLVQFSKTQSLENGDIQKWINDYELASNGE